MLAIWCGISDITEELVLNDDTIDPEEKTPIGDYEPGSSIFE